MSLCLISQEPKKVKQGTPVKVDTITVAERKIDSVKIEQKQVANKLDSLIQEQKKKK